MPDKTSTDKTKKLLMVLITLLLGGIVLFAVSFFLSDLSHGKRADQITYHCEELTGFVRVEGDERTPVELPAYFELAEEEPLILETTLPDLIPDDTWICYSSGMNSKLYVDGELRKTFDKHEGTIPGGAVKRLHLFLELFPQDAGKTFRIERTGLPDNGGQLHRVYIGTSLGIIERIISNNIVNFILTIALLLIALMAIGIGLLLRFYKKIVSPITSMGIGVLFVTLWLIFDSELYQLAFRNYYIDGTMSFIMMLLIPYPFIYYMDMLQEHRYRLAYAFLCLYLEIATICASLLHFSKTVDFLTMLPFLAAAVGIVLFAIVITMIIDYFKGYYKSYLVSFVGVSGLAVSCIAELILILTVDERKDGSCIIIGLFWTITLAIVHQLYAVRQAQKEAAVAVRASETKTNFLANMSHEIRTPMNAILGMDEMILREAKGNERITKYASDIRSAGNMLLSIINDILDLSKIETGKAELILTDFDICSVINDLINIVSRRAADKGIAFSFDADEKIPVRLHGDEIRSRQIMLNIINNAVKYTNEGSVSVTMEAEQGEEKSIILVVTVKDTGIGIRPEDKNRLFTPFDRLEETKNRNIEGTGLGLSIAGNYVKLMGGEIGVESEYGEGSVFTIRMPYIVVDPTPIGNFTERIKELSKNAKETRPTAIAPRASALVVDDNEMNLEVIAGLMERTRMRVDLSLSGPDALDKMEKRRYDIIFLDQMMPGMDGVATLKEMHARYDLRGRAVIALTADAVAGAKEFYLSQGFDDYLSKPVQAEALENVLVKHLPKNLLLTEEDVARVTEAEEKRRKEREESKASVVVVDPDKDSLKEIREQTEGLLKGTFVTDMEKAERYLEKHDADYVMVKRELLFGKKDSGGDIE